MDGITLGFNPKKGFYMEEYVRLRRNRTHKGKSLITFPQNYIIIDIETTGLWPEDRILEIGAVKFINEQEVDSFQTFIAPYFEPGESRNLREYIPPDIEQLTGINYKILKGAPKISNALRNFSDFIRDEILVAHNANFDINFLYDHMERFLDTYLTNDFIDTLRISRKVFPEFASHSMSALIDEFRIDKTDQHRAIADCLLCNKVFSICRKEVENISPEEWSNRFKPKSDRPATKTQPSDNYNPMPESRFYDKTVTFTGTLSSMDRQDAMQLVVDIGGYVGDNVTKKTDFLVMGIQDYHKFTDGKESRKTKKVKELQQKGQIIHIISEDDFFKILFNIK